MDFNERLEKIKMLLAAAGSIVTNRKKLQKLAYICQSAGEPLGQSFVFHHYGVYSPSLADDIRAAAAMGIVDELDGAGSVVTKLKVKANLDSSSKGFALVEQLKDKEARVLEVLTTILYLNSHGYKGNELNSKLNALKGQHSSFFSEAYQLSKENFNIASS
jgi:uncharacterized protein YwgA